MTIPEAAAASTLLRYLAPGSTVPAEDAADAAAYLTGKVHGALLAGPDPDQVRKWVETRAAKADADRDEMERLRAEVKRRDQDAARWRHVEPILTRHNASTPEADHG